MASPTVVKIIYNFEIITAAGDDLAPLGARSFAGTVATKFGSHALIWGRLLKSQCLWAWYLLLLIL